MVRHAVGFLVWMSAVGEGLGEETTIWRKTCCFHWKGGAAAEAADRRMSSWPRLARLGVLPR